MTLILIVAAIVSIFLVCITLIIAANLWFFPRLRNPVTDKAAPFVSILIPARNEADSIGLTIQSILAQSNSNFELLVLNDNSSDETVSKVLEAGGEDERVRLLEGRSLPSGWLGKNWACHQLAEAASGDYLLFVDADVTLQPQALAALMQHAQQESSDLLTIWPTQQTESWAERLTVPLISLVVLGYLPVLMVHHTPWRVFAAANGQCLLFHRHAYQQIGGHRAVRGQIVEDVALSRHVKGCGLKLRMADGSGLIRCRMYSNWPEVRDGFAKNILAGHGQSSLFLMASTLFHWMVFILPWFWLFAGGGLWPLLLVAIGVGARAITAYATGQRVRDALLMPISVVLMTSIAGRSIFWHWRGRTQWKGRVATT
jgi:chlorobactene glucosyltransferase